MRSTLLRKRGFNGPADLQRMTRSHRRWSLLKEMARKPMGKQSNSCFFWGSVDFYSTISKKILTFFQSTFVFTIQSNRILQFFSQFCGFSQPGKPAGSANIFGRPLRSQDRPDALSYFMGVWYDDSPTFRRRIFGCRVFKIGWSGLKFQHVVLL